MWRQIRLEKDTSGRSRKIEKKIDTTSVGGQIKGQEKIDITRHGKEIDRYYRSLWITAETEKDRV